MADEIQFTNVHVESERRIRAAVAEFKAKRPAEDWSITIYGLPEAPNFKVWIVTPDDHKVGPILVTNTLEADREILALLEDLQEDRHINTPVVLPPV